MSLPDPAPVDCHYEWVVENAFGWLAWRVVTSGASKRCRHTDHGERCTAQSVAMIQRGRKQEQWWHYCEDHMYGRRVLGRRVWVIHAVPDSEPLRP